MNPVVFAALIFINAAAGALAGLMYGRSGKTVQCRVILFLLGFSLVSAAVAVWLG